MKTKFYLVRHGKTEASVKGIVQGVGLNISLVEEGLDQARVLAENLKDFNFDKIFTSTSKRSIEANEFIKKHHNKTPIEKIIDLNERSKGTAEGMLKSDFNKKYPEILDQWSREEDARVPAGENYEDVEKRIKVIFESHLEKYAGKDLLYVVHGNLIRVLLGYVLDIPYGKRARISQDYCALNIIIYDHERQRWGVEVVNKVFS